MTRLSRCRPLSDLSELRTFIGRALSGVYSVVGNEARTYGRDHAKSTRAARKLPLKSLFRRKPRPAPPAGERVYAIGDIHGRIDLFDALVTAIESDNAARGPARVSLILLGDLVDRGPDSAAVVERAMRWKRDFARLECLLGNHEAAMLAVLRGDTGWLESWLSFGGEETLMSYGVERPLLTDGAPGEIVAAARAAVPPAHIAWLSGLPLHIARGDYLFVHAGIRPGVALATQHPDDLLWIREDFLDDATDHGAVVIHGHSISLDVEERANRIGIDTGAFASGMLTAIGLEGSERWYLKT